MTLNLMHSKSLIAGDTSGVDECPTTATPEYLLSASRGSSRSTSLPLAINLISAAKLPLCDYIIYSKRVCEIVIRHLPDWNTTSSGRSSSKDSLVRMSCSSLSRAEHCSHSGKHRFFQSDMDFFVNGQSEGFSAQNWWL